jgi:hypothetical protein
VVQGNFFISFFVLIDVLKDLTIISGKTVEVVNRSPSLDMLAFYSCASSLPFELAIGLEVSTEATQLPVWDTVCHPYHLHDSMSP